MKKAAGMTRAQYKSVKRMDHKQMEGFVANIYNDGFEAGKEAAGQQGIQMSEVEAALAGVSGVGTKKAASIIAAISRIQKE